MARLVLALTLLLAFPCGALAQLALPQSVRVHLASWHDRGDFNNANVGLGLRWKGGLTLGGYQNSFGRPSWYGGITVPIFESRAFELQLMTGVVSGYSETGPVDLVAVPSLGWRLSPHGSLQAVFMPRFVLPANVVHVMYERRLGGASADPARRR